MMLVLFCELRVAPSRTLASRFGLRCWLSLNRDLSLNCFLHFGIPMLVDNLLKVSLSFLGLLNFLFTS
jgi:hypothetical protein